MPQRLPSAIPVIKNHLERTLKIKWDKILKDPSVRKKKCTWNFGYLMQMLCYSILSGCKNLREMETFTERYHERIPDTTMHDKIIGIDAIPLRNFLASQVKEALHDHELDEENFPMRVTAVDSPFRLIDISFLRSLPYRCGRSLMESQFQFQKSRQAALVSVLRRMTKCTIITGY